MTLYQVVEALNIGDVIPFFLDIDDIHCKEVIGATVFSSAMAPRIFLVVLVFFAGLALVGRRFLGVLSTKHISMRRISGLILSKVFVLFLG